MVWVTEGKHQGRQEKGSQSEYTAPHVFNSGFNSILGLNVK